MHIENYRGLEDLEIPSFRRLNIIGGYNGTGKTTLLEAIFFILDRRGPIALSRPFTWRKLGIGQPESLNKLFSDLDTTKLIKISTITAGGNFEIAIKYGTTPPGVTIQTPQTKIDGSSEQQLSLNNSNGLDVQVSLNGKHDDGFFVITMPPDLIGVTPYRTGLSQIPSGAMISPTTRNIPQDDSNRFTNVVKQKKLKELLKIVSIVRPSITNIQLLQEGNDSVLYAELDSSDSLQPFPMLGDGVQTILSIALAIMNLEGGVLFLDEFESAIHYSLLPTVWENIATLADKYNCQVFAVTHSKECIKASLEGAKKAHKKNDLQYIRLEKNNSKNTAIIYDADELEESLNAEWEIR
jgi:AAA15 family ATPase/GTPase